LMTMFIVLGVLVVPEILVFPLHSSIAEIVASFATSSSFSRKPIKRFRRSSRPLLVRVVSAAAAVAVQEVVDVALVRIVMFVVDSVVKVRVALVVAKTMVEMLADMVEVTAAASTAAALLLVVSMLVAAIVVVVVVTAVAATATLLEDQEAALGGRLTQP